MYSSQSLVAKTFKNCSPEITLLSYLFAVEKACNNTICKNNGTCLNLLEGYHCTCVAGYTGENCEIGLYFSISFKDSKGSKTC